MNIDLNNPQTLYIIAGAVFCFVALFLWRMLRKERDPLPELDPNCIWHCEVVKVDKIYDGDTFFAHVKGHKPIDGKPVGIRIRGIDTPEMKDRRPAVKKKAEAAKALVEAEFAAARKIHLYNVSMTDKYGRMLATVFCDRKDLAKMLLRKKLAKSYDGGAKKVWK
ncbi:MAG: thermonuclease family protein [Desulfobacterales bacterium]